MKPNILAHRGASAKAPENTRLAFEKAVEDKADGVEFDVHMTQDEELVVIHDETLDRTTDKKGKISELTISEIKQADAGGFYENEYYSQEVLTLEETLAIVKDLSIINIEIKKRNPSSEFLNKVIEDVEKFNIKNQVIISSFDHHCLNKLKKIAPDIRIGILYFAGIFRPWEYAKKLKAEAIHPYYESIRSETVKDCHNNNIQVNIFGTSKKEEIKKLVKMKVDSIITDSPKNCRKLLDSIL